MTTLQNATGVAFIVIVPLTLLLIFFSNPKSEIWEDNRELFSGIWFFYIYIGTNIIEHVLSEYSSLFSSMTFSMRRQDANHIMKFASNMLLFLPAGVKIVSEVFRLGPEEFVTGYSGVTRCLIGMGIIGEMIDLMSKNKPSRRLMIHHSIEIICGGLVIDSNFSGSGFGPGFVLLAMVNVVGTCVSVCMIFSHVQREGKEDKVFPSWYLSVEGMINIFKISTVLQILAVVVQPIVYTSVYMGIYYESIIPENRIILPIVTVLVIMIDFPTIIVFREKSGWGRSLDENIV